MVHPINIIHHKRLSEMTREFSLICAAPKFAKHQNLNQEFSNVLSVFKQSELNINDTFMLSSDCLKILGKQP